MGQKTVKDKRGKKLIHVILNLPRIIFFLNYAMRNQTENIVTCKKN